MPANYTHTTRATGTTLTAAIYNADHQNHVTNGNTALLDDYSATVTEMQIHTADGQVGTESLPSNLAGDIERLRFAIRGTKQAVSSNLATDHWYESPVGYSRFNKTGFIAMFGRVTAPPAGWRYCNGDAISRTTFAALFAIIGTTFGAGDGSTTFNVPDFRSRSPIGAGQGAGLTNRVAGTFAGAETAVADVPSHTHGVTDPGHNHTGSFAADGAHTHDVLADNSTATTNQGFPAHTTSGTSGSLQPAVFVAGAGAHAHSVSTSSAQPPSISTDSQGGATHDNMQPFINIPFIIKT